MLFNIVNYFLANCLPTVKEFLIAVFVYKPFANKGLTVDQLSVVYTFEELKSDLA